MKAAVRRKTPPKYFNPGIEYDELLSKFQEDFFQLWDNEKVSSENGLEGYDEIATLGAGSFGRVVNSCSNGNRFQTNKIRHFCLDSGQRTSYNQILCCQNTGQRSNC